MIASSIVGTQLALFNAICSMHKRSDHSHWRKLLKCNLFAFRLMSPLILSDFCYTVDSVYVFHLLSSQSVWCASLVLQ